MATLKLILAFFLSFFQILSPVGAIIVNFGEGNFFAEWSVTDEFTADYCVELEKNPDEDFVILNLADVQLKDDLVYEEEGEKTVQMIDDLVRKTEPDLITLTGDNAWGTVAYINLVKQIDGYGIPWAPIMGNHDGQCCINEFWAAHLLFKAENCLFEFGPEDMGYGNYIINITENGHIIHTLFMVDTHDGAEFTLEDGSTISGYDHLWNNQIEWYKWAVKGISEIEGHTVESSVFMHIPVYEYKDAWVAANGSEEPGELNPELAPDAIGVCVESVCSSPVNNGFFDVCKELGSTKNIFAGHDHANNFQIYYEGIRLNYTLKTGYGAYYTEGLVGGTVISIDSDGSAYAEHIFMQD
ncbi:MAG: metallophosphoesterase [Clostridia bacterium]|nr:metallophosphoesterase [Clostridia bacterium]